VRRRRSRCLRWKWLDLDDGVERYWTVDVWERFTRALQVLDPHLDTQAVRVDVQQHDVVAVRVEATPCGLDLLRERAVDEADLVQRRADRRATVGAARGDRLQPLVGQGEVVQRAQYRSGTND
jgi:hypothetical protein